MVSWGKTLALLLVALFLTSLVTLSSAVTVQAASTWSIQTVDKNASDSSVIALDSNNKPHIVCDSYQGRDYPGNYNIMYARLNGSNWNIQTAIPGAVCFDFVLDSDNSPHILYFNRIAQGLMYASYRASNWTTQIVDKEGFTGTLALDSADNPHIAYIGGNEIIKVCLVGRVLVGAFKR